MTNTLLLLDDPIKHMYRDNTRANFIYDNLKHMDTHEKTTILSQILSEHEINKLLLNYELRFMNSKIKTDNLEEFTKIALNYLNRYQGTIGLDKLLEDNKWNIRTHTDNIKKYDIDEGTIIFDNSMLEKNYNKYETHEYLRNLVKLLSSLSDTIKVSLKYLKLNKHGIIWTVIQCSK
jgi:hypothetical protein